MLFPSLSPSYVVQTLVLGSSNSLCLLLALCVKLDSPPLLWIRGNQQIELLWLVYLEFMGVSLACQSELSFITSRVGGNETKCAFWLLGLQFD